MVVVLATVDSLLTTVVVIKREKGGLRIATCSCGTDRKERGQETKMKKEVLRRYLNGIAKTYFIKLIYGNALA